MPLQIGEQVLALSAAAQVAVLPQFAAIDAISERHTQRVLEAFHAHRVSDGHFAGTTGYGYDDLGRDTLDLIYADLFGTEDALVRIGFVNGTHAIAAALFGALRPGDTLVSAVGTPYDTMLGVIGAVEKSVGSLAEYGVNYVEVPLKNNAPDLAAVIESAKGPNVRAVLIQRSKGYATRASLSVAEIGTICAAVKAANPSAITIVDNCYGEFVEEAEPTHVGADLVAGSLIKNLGGGLAPTGGYLAGRHALIEAAAMRLTAPGIGRACGSTLGNNRHLYQGLFMAPHTVAQALKTAVFGAKLLQLMGYTVAPCPEDTRHDIIQMIEFGEPEKLKRFCRGIQKGAPIDSFLTPEPWAMPGYDCEVIMAAGAFIQGASIELSADAPLREPFTAYLQGGLTYESGKAGIMLAAEELLHGK